MLQLSKCTAAVFLSNARTVQRKPRKKDSHGVDRPSYTMISSAILLLLKLALHISKRPTAVHHGAATHNHSWVPINSAPISWLQRGSGKRILQRPRGALPHCSCFGFASPIRTGQSRHDSVERWSLKTLTDWYKRLTNVATQTLSLLQYIDKSPNPVSVYFFLLHLIVG